jgi:hypothetical protein
MPDYTLYKGFFRLKWFNKFTLYLAYGLQLTREIDLEPCAYGIYILMIPDWSEAERKRNIGAQQAL